MRTRIYTADNNCLKSTLAKNNIYALQALEWTSDFYALQKIYSYQRFSSHIIHLALSDSMKSDFVLLTTLQNIP